jgi:subtilisin family serine protease
MKKTLTLFLLAFWLLAGGASNAFSFDQGIVTDQLKQKIESSDPAEMIRINIRLKEQFDSQKLANQSRTMSKSEKRAYVVSVLKEFSRLSQEGVIADLNSYQQSGAVKQLTTLWIANVVNCFATAEVIDELSKRNDISSIDFDEYRVLIDQDENKDAIVEQGNSGSREITWNVIKINADDVWALGINGAGIVVSVIDTGVNYEHFDLADHVWESAEFPNHGYDFINDDNNPMDDHGHGTHCAGTVAGDGTSGTQTGVAPEATIMCCKVLDAGGGGNESGVWAAIQFSVEQGADVMSLSLGWQHSWGVDRATWRTSFDNAMAAGIIASVAAGNEGDQQGTYPIPDNVRTPGDLPPAWLHPDQTLIGGVSGIICIGATDVNDNLAGFSSRGPMDWSEVSPFNDYPYQPEMGLIRPDICAPGVDITSLDYSSNNGYASGWSGTSMATPANAGVIALMLQKNNLLTPEQIDQTLEETAVVLVPGKNNNSGSGRVDALAAVEATTMPGPSYYSHIINDAAGNNNGIVEPSEQILLTVAMANFSEEIADNVNVVLSSESSFITITDNTEFFGSFDLASVVEIENAFAFDVANNIPGGKVIKFYLTATNDTDSWQSSFSVTANGVALSIGNFTISDLSGNNNGSLDPGETVDILIQTSNNGQIDAENALASIVSPSAEITINTADFSFGTIVAGQTATALFNITVSAAAAIGTVVELNYNVVSGNYTEASQFYPKIGLIIEDFETGDFSQYDWQFNGNQPWTVSSTDAFEGAYCSKSGTIDDNQSSEMYLTMDIANDDSIAFYRKVSSEASYDFLTFYMDDVVMESNSGEVDWARVSYGVTQGTHTFRWVYNKDISVVGGSDCAWVDEIELPTVVNESMMVNAGTDGEICDGAGFQTNAFAQNYITTAWSTSGNGAFDDNSLLNAFYTPSASDYEAGSVVLSLTVYGENEQTLTDDLLLSFMPMPGQASEISGESIVCMGRENPYSTTTLAGAASYQWVLTPAEAGVITGEGEQVSIQWAEVWTGMVTLTVEGLNDCGGGGLSQVFEIQVDDCTGIDDLLASNDFVVTPNPGNGLFTLTFGKSSNTTYTVSIMNMIGEKVFETIYSGNNHATIDVCELKNGLYFIVVDNGGHRKSQKLIIQK